MGDHSLPGSPIIREAPAFLRNASGASRRPAYAGGPSA